MRFVRYVFVLLRSRWLESITKLRSSSLLRTLLHLKWRGARKTVFLLMRRLAVEARDPGSKIPAPKQSPPNVPCPENRGLEPELRSTT